MNELNYCGHELSQNDYNVIKAIHNNVVRHLQYSGSVEVCNNIINYTINEKLKITISSGAALALNYKGIETMLNDLFFVSIV